MIIIKKGKYTHMMSGKIPNFNAYQQITGFRRVFKGIGHPKLIFPPFTTILMDVFWMEGKNSIQCQYNASLLWECTQT